MIDGWEPARALCYKVFKMQDHDVKQKQNPLILEATIPTPQGVLLQRWKFVDVFHSFLRFVGDPEQLVLII
jgi:hypothetical protein